MGSSEGAGWMQVVVLGSGVSFFCLKIRMKIQIFNLILI